MSLLIFLVQILAHTCRSPATSLNNTFLFNGFRPSDLNLSDSATVTRTGALSLTNGHLATNPGIKGHAFYPAILQFKKPPGAKKTHSFSTRFVFEIVSHFPESGGHGFAFVLAPATNFSQATGGSYLGLFNRENNGNPSNHVFAVEFDTVQQEKMNDKDGNHVGIDVNGANSSFLKPATYYTEFGKKEKVVLDCQTTIQAWIEYDGQGKQLNVTIAPLSHPLKPNCSLISYSIDLSPVLLEHMYVGFSDGIQKLESKHYILAWSFAMDGKAPELDLSRLPSIPRDHTPLWKSFKLFLFVSAALVALLFLIIRVGISYLIKRKRKLTSEKIEGWEMDYPHRLPYKKIYRATKGFKEELGKGGFGSVYKGVLPRSGIEVAVKRVSHGSKQGMREFVAELSSLGRMRHRNLVQLHGWCRRGEDLLLVYEFMQNGSLDSHLFGTKESRLSWEQRFKILKGIAFGLLYLHEEWEQVVVHRDVKASNVLLDGALLQEVACGRRPIEPERPSEEMILVELVHSMWKGGRILDAMDKRLGTSFVVEEAELVLKLGLLCSQSAPESRPNMRQLTQFLNGDVPLQDLEHQNLGIHDQA